MVGGRGVEETGSAIDSGLADDVLIFSSVKMRDASGDSGTISVEDPSNCLLRLVLETGEGFLIHGGIIFSNWLEVLRTVELRNNQQIVSQCQSKIEKKWKNERRT